MRSASARRGSARWHHATARVAHAAPLRCWCGLAVGFLGVSLCIAHDEVVVLLTPAASTKSLARILKEEWICISTGSGYHAVSTCTLIELRADVFEIFLMEIATSQARRASSGRCCNGYICCGPLFPFLKSPEAILCEAVSIVFCVPVPPRP